MGSNSESSNCSKLVACLNRSCGQKFDPEFNGPEDCKYHPGAPVFHDGLKGWSCCKRRVRDFTEFLNITGCARGQHSNEKPPMPCTPNSVPEACPAPLVCSTDGFQVEQRAIKLIEPRLPRFEDIHRPPSDESLFPIRIHVTDSLKKAIESSGEQSEVVAKPEGLVIGSKCHRKSCKALYTGDASQEDEKCTHHPGWPVFHDGMKYYTCCQRKTCDFDEFEAQLGCSIVRGHLWQIAPTEKFCRNEFFQQGNFVTLTYYAKNPLVCKCRVEANCVKLKLTLVWEAGKSHLERCIDLFGTVDPTSSEVRYSPTKVEIQLQKRDKLVWTRLDCPPPPPPQPQPPVLPE